MCSWQSKHPSTHRLHVYVIKPCAFNINDQTTWPSSSTLVFSKTSSWTNPDSSMRKPRDRDRLGSTQHASYISWQPRVLTQKNWIGIFNFTLNYKLGTLFFFFFFFFPFWGTQFICFLLFLTGPTYLPIFWQFYNVLLNKENPRESCRRCFKNR